MKTASGLRSLELLTKTFDGLRMKSSSLQGKRSVIAKNAQNISENVANAKARLLCADEVSAVFKDMQQKAHARAVNLFERLLTAILNDVLPGEGSIALELGMKGNQSTLDVNLVNPQGYPTDILEGNGGALTNIVCAGLRFAALSRTSNRKFMILDEPDCWIQPMLVPMFMKVLSDVSLQTHTQTLFISHYPDESFGEDITRVKLSSQNDEELIANAVEPIAANWENDEVEGIRSIELINFMAHKHTTIPCFPGATALIGDNNKGKSVMVRAMRAVAHNDSADKHIYHGADFAKIVIRLEENQRLEWSRNPSRNPVVSYELFKDDVLIASGRPPSRNVVPEFVRDLLGIECINGLDIQLSDQKTPVFLLNESSLTRAQLLTVGKESHHVNSLIEKYDTLKKKDKSDVKIGEAQLTGLYDKLNAAELLDDADIQILRANEILGTIASKANEIADLDSRIYEFEQLNSEIEVLESLVKIYDAMPIAPQIHDTDLITKMIEILTQHSKIAGVTCNWRAPDFPELFDVTDITNVGIRISKGEKARANLTILQNILVDVDYPITHDLHDVDQIILRLANSQSSIQRLNDEILDMDAQANRLQHEYEQLMLQFGGDCPLCGGKFHSAITGGSHVHME